MTDDDRQRRAGENEALFREVNERIGDLAETFSVLTGDLAVVCECAKVGCLEQIQVTKTVYESVRARPDHFIVTPGHEESGIESVVETDPTFVIVEKRGLAEQIAEETDPRS
jgi:hypothetical protein